MSKHNENSESDGPVRGRSGPRGRLPVRAKLLLDDSLPVNENHPLGKSAPETRAANRLRLIAGVLARMAKLALGRED